MIVWKGKAVCGGIAIGTALVYRQKKENIKKQFAEDKAAEREKYAAVKTLAIDELDRLFKKAKSEIGEKEAQIFSIHKMMVQDVCYNESVLNIIEKQKMNAETAVLMTSNNFEKLFQELDNAYMRERASDIRDVSDRIVSLLRGKGRILPPAMQENSIIFASNITPGETLMMDKSKIAAFVTERGSETSHTAILARSLGIPAVTGIKVSGNMDGKRVAIDGYTGTVYVEPDEKTVEKLKNRARKAEKKRTKQNLVNGAKVLASISAPEEVKCAEIAESDGIGVFKSEALFRNAETFPNEAYQFDAYRKMLEGAKEVAVRALDIEADKKGTFFGIFKEENAALGMRSIRLCLKYPQIFKTQLRAILKASTCGKIKILLPMITSEEEVTKTKKLLDEVKNGLIAEKKEFDGNIPLGVVIETPASVMISDRLSKLCDFFLIDADGLAQYTLAMDRKNIALAELFDRHHTAVIKMIELAAESGRKGGIPVGICGDIASDIDKIPGLLKMGIKEFSVSPKNIANVRRAIYEYEKKEAEK